MTAIPESRDTEQAAKTKLLPCPFCGGAGWWVSEHDSDGHGVFYAIQCGKCSASTRQMFASNGNDCPQFRDEVRSEWNRRPALASAPQAPVQQPIPNIPARLVNGQWEGEPIANYPELQAVVRRLIENGTFSVGCAATPQPAQQADDAKDGERKALVTNALRAAQEWHLALVDTELSQPAQVARRDAFRRAVYELAGVEYEPIDAAIEKTPGAPSAAIGDGWHPIDTAPKDGSYIWLGNSNNLRIAFWSKGAEWEHNGSVGGGWRDMASAEALHPDSLHFVPTHWMPCPARPPAA